MTELPPKEDRRVALVQQWNKIMNKSVTVEQTQQSMAELLEARRQVIPTFDTTKMISAGDAQAFGRLHDELYAMTYTRLQAITQPYAATIQALLEVARRGNPYNLLYNDHEAKQLTLTKPSDSPDHTWFINFRYRSERVADPDQPPTSKWQKMLQAAGRRIGFGGNEIETTESAAFILADTNNLKHLHQGFTLESTQFESFFPTIRISSKQSITGITRAIGIKIGTDRRMEGLIFQQPARLAMDSIAAYPLTEHNFHGGNYQILHANGFSKLAKIEEYHLGRDGFIRRGTVDIAKPPLEIEIAGVMDTLPFEKMDNSETAEYLRKWKEKTGTDLE